MVDCGSNVFPRIIARMGEIVVQARSRTDHHGWHLDRSYERPAGGGGDHAPADRWDRTGAGGQHQSMVPAHAGRQRQLCQWHLDDARGEQPCTALLRLGCCARRPRDRRRRRVRQRRSGHAAQRRAVRPGVEHLDDPAQSSRVGAHRGCARLGASRRPFHRRPGRHAQHGHLRPGDQRLDRGREQDKQRGRGELVAAARRHHPRRGLLEPAERGEVSDRLESVGGGRRDAAGPGRQHFGDRRVGADARRPGVRDRRDRFHGAVHAAARGQPGGHVGGRPDDSPGQSRPGARGGRCAGVRAAERERVLLRIARSRHLPRSRPRRSSSNTTRSPTRSPTCRHRRCRTRSATWDGC